MGIGIGVLGRFTRVWREEEEREEEVEEGGGRQFSCSPFSHFVGGGKRRRRDGDAASTGALATATQPQPATGSELSRGIPYLCVAQR